MPRLLVSLTVLLAATAAAPVPASAANRKGSKSNSVVKVTGPFLEVGSAPESSDATCPAGTKVVGGGFGTDATIASGFGVPGGGPVVAALGVVLESRRIDNRTWRATVKAVGNPAGGVFAGSRASFAVDAFCRRFRGTTSEVAAGGPTSESSPSIAVAGCPRGTVAMAGGFSIPNSTDPGFAYPSIYESERVGKRAWRTSAAPGTQSSISITSYAYCARGVRAPRIRSRMATGDALAPKCPSGLAAGDGGFLTAPGSLILASSGVNDTSTNKRTVEVPNWVGTSFSVDGGPSALTTFAYCS